MRAYVYINWECSVGGGICNYMHCTTHIIRYVCFCISLMVASIYQFAYLLDIICGFGCRAEENTGLWIYSTVCELRDQRECNAERIFSLNI